MSVSVVSMVPENVGADLYPDKNICFPSTVDEMFPVKDGLEENPFNVNSAEFEE